MEQQTFDLTSAAKKTGPVTCLGMTFPDEAARRAHFTALLAEKLKDPEFRKIEGFPLGTDEDILALSDPPYYCACPNPWINDFLKEWEAAKPPKPMGYKYEREPFAADVSEGKNDPIYNAHSYHTKVPHKAIMRYILHYTEPGDIVFDGFCGTGMTGVAAQLCGDIEQVRSLGYKVDEKTGAITDPNAEDPKKVISHLGARKAVLNDLSPAATFIAYNYNTPVDVEEFEREAKRILKEVEDECGWMYETQHVDSKGKPVIGADGKPLMGTINYVVWSDVFVCPHCSMEFSYWDGALDEKGKTFRKELVCPHCQAVLPKLPNRAKQLSVTTRDRNIIEPIVKQNPVMIVYTANGKRYKKLANGADFELLDQIASKPMTYWVPEDITPPGMNTDQPRRSHGIDRVSKFYWKRTLFLLSSLKAHISPITKFVFTGIVMRATRMNRIHVKNFFHGGGGWNAGYLKGTLYVPALPIETSVCDMFEDRASSIRKALNIRQHFEKGLSCISLRSSTEMRELPDACLDYLFLDPPFGANINYSELNCIWEAWLGVKTNNKDEAIENETQNKGASEYRTLMRRCFAEAYRLLKPGRWITIEFSNTSSAVWNSIQSSLSEAGFIISGVSALDKKQGSFKAVTTPTAVKQDLVITAYKPDENFEARFKLESETEDGVWDFVRTHLSKLPVCKVKNGKLLTIPERDPRILFDQVVSYYVRKNLNVPISSRDFQEGLAVRYSQRDGMFFLPEQAAAYDKKKALQKYEVDEGADMFIHDEASAISWLRSVLGKKPQTYSSVQPQYLQAPTSISKHEELPDLRELLKDNFLCYDAAKDGDVPSQIHTLLSTNYHELRNLPKDNSQLKEKADGMWYVPDPNKASDLEKLREKSLLKEFEAYRAEKKLKKFRLEVVRAGFKKAFADKDFATILGVGAKIPEDVINEDDKLLMWYNIAQRLGGR